MTIYYFYEINERASRRTKFKCSHYPEKTRMFQNEDGTYTAVIAYYVHVQDSLIDSFPIFIYSDNLLYNTLQFYTRGSYKDEYNWFDKKKIYPKDIAKCELEVDNLGNNTLIDTKNYCIVSYSDTKECHHCPEECIITWNFFEKVAFVFVIIVVCPYVIFQIIMDVNKIINNF